MASTTPTGSRARIWKQDPTVAPIGVRITYVPSEILAGPKDSDIVIKGLPVVQPDKNGDFLFDPTKSADAFDAVHTFVVVRQVLTMYQRALRRMGRTKEPLTWQWKNGPIQVSPRAGVDTNAYYSRQEKAIKFFYFTDKNTKKQVFTNRSFDVVAHETGHAILDALRPNYWNSWHPQTGGLHEAMGDITAILTMLSQLDQCETIITYSKSDLHVKSFFNSVAEQFGEALYGHRQGLRNADNNLTLSDVSDQVHDISQVFTGAFYDILADIFEDMRDPLVHDDAYTLFRTGEHMMDLIVESLLRGPAQNATFADIANKMMAVESNALWKKIIRKQFEVRKVLGRDMVKPLRKPKEGMKWQACHCCLATKEHTDAVNAAIKAQQSKGWFRKSA